MSEWKVYSGFIDPQESASAVSLSWPAMWMACRWAPLFMVHRRIRQVKIHICGDYVARWWSMCATVVESLEQTSVRLP